MIKHIVFFQLADEAEGRSKAENALMLKKEFEKLIDLIPDLKNIEVGINHPDTPASNYDLAVYCEFNSVEDLNIYQEHPEHKKVGAILSKIRTGRACVDYEV